MPPPSLAPHKPSTRQAPAAAGPSGLVIFGITGDLSRKKILPAVYDLTHRGLLPTPFPLVGVARRQQHQDFEHAARQTITRHARAPFREETWHKLRRHLHVIEGDFEDDHTFETLRATLDRLSHNPQVSGNFAFYFSTPPACFPTLIHQLTQYGLALQRGGTWRRIALEKPFGHDAASAHSLNTTLETALAPEQIFRIDHYLAKETVQNILALRFTNTVFEPMWNRRYIDHVQITLAEETGVGDRAGYYEGTGAARDVLQNHLLQLLALTAMEPPPSLTAEALATEKLKVLHTLHLADDAAKCTVRGQYAPGRHQGQPVPGYLQEEGVHAASRTETYAALTLKIDNPRWADVPFYLRTGKRLGRRATEIVLVFRPAPLLPFATGAEHEREPNALVLRLQPDPGMTLRFGTKTPGDGIHTRDVTMDFPHTGPDADPGPDAYERLLLDLLRGDPHLFLHAEEIEQSWKVLDEARTHWAVPDRPPTYLPGTWGPAEADEMLARDGRSWWQP